MPKATAPVDAIAPDQRGRAPPLRAVAHLWITRTVTSRHVLVSEDEIDPCRLYMSVVYVWCRLNFESSVKVCGGLHVLGINHKVIKAISPKQLEP